MARSFAFGVPVCLATVLLAACGGGGGGGSSVLPATGGTVPPPSGGNAAPASVAFSILIPTVSTSAHGRRPRYISAGTKSVSISYGGNRQTADCTTTCSVQLSVPPGTVTFDVGLYDASAGSGHLLSSGQTTAVLAPGQQNAINITFAGVVASVALALGSASVTAGTPATIPVIVAAKDAAGYTIVGSEPFANPIMLSTDASSAATLSTSSLSAPSSALTLAYNGSATISAVHVSASVAGTSIAAAPATLAVQSAPVAPPPGNVPVREATWYYYGVNDVNSKIPASWMAAHTDYVESSDDPSFAQSFKNAGGKFAAYYTDPAYSPYCFAPFTPGTKTCQGPFGSYGDESTWFHGADGTRIRRYMDAHFGYQEAIDPGSASAQAAYRRLTSDLLAQAPGLDYFFADDSGGPFIGGDGTVMTGWFWNFNAPAVEITSEAAFIPAEQAMLASPARPVIVNGVNPQTLQPSYNGKWLDSPNVAGVNFEGCYGDGNGVAGESGNRWANQSNGLLATYAHHSKAVCMLMADATPANRIYDLASWWMTYTEPYSVAAPISKTADGFTVVPEFDIVPRQPRATATSDVRVLRSSTGAYVREFAACYQAGTSIGPCAAVVNESSSSEPLPALAGRYTSSLVVDDRSSYNGGKATWTGAIPASLPPLSALVLR